MLCKNKNRAAILAYPRGPNNLSPTAHRPKLRAQEPKRQKGPRNVKSDTKKLPGKPDLETLSGTKFLSERLGFEYVLSARTHLLF